MPNIPIEAIFRNNDNALEMWKLCYGTECLMRAKHSFETIRNTRELAERDREAHIHAGIISYGNIFGSAHLPNGQYRRIFPEDIVPREYLATHKLIIDLRNKSIAHTDGRQTEGEGKQLNSLYIRRKTDSYVFSTLIHEDIEETHLTNSIQLCRDLIGIMEERQTRILDEERIDERMFDKAIGDHKLVFPNP